MLNFKLIYKILGQLLFLEALLMSLCLAMALFYREDDAMAFAISIAIIVGSGFMLKYKGRMAENSMNRRDAYLLVTLTWALFSFFGAFPFTISGYISDYTDAFFETMSGFTTTGATIIDDVEALPHGLLFWRSMTQWIGGLGIAFFTIAILPSLVGGSIRVFAAESTGPIKSKVHPRISSSAKSIWLVYLLLTLSCAVCLYLGGMNLFDCTNYSMSITATGGFAPYNDSTGHFHSAFIDYTTIAFMFLSGTNFTLLYLTFFKRKFLSLFQNSEFKLYVLVVSLATMGIMYFLIRFNGYDMANALRSALFQVVSFITTTGVFNDDAGKWPHITWVILSICMFIGACAGSTSGGFKSVRGVILFKVVRNELRRILHPKAERQFGEQFGTGHAARVLRPVYGVVYLCILLSDMYGSGQHKLHHYRHELCEQRGTDAGTGNRTYRVVEYPACRGQVDLFRADADGPTGDIQRSSAVHPWFLEGQITHDMKENMRFPVEGDAMF